MKNIIIGILGGMGTYATIHVFEQYAKIFPANKEWERPRLIIDNNCTMPSRVRAFLENYKKEILLNEMTNSLIHLKNVGCNKIILACNTSHLFLNEIFIEHPELKSLVINIIDKTVEKINKNKIKKCFLLASEGTIYSKIFQNKLNCEVIIPTENELKIIRNCIESVKLDKITEEIKNDFKNLILKHDNIILGCTELPILYDKIYINKNIFNPVEIALNYIKEEYE